MSQSKLVQLLGSERSSRLLKDESLTEAKRVPSISSCSGQSEAGGSVVITKNADPVAPVEQEDDEDEEYVLEPPLPPPKELHPGKLYALYEFSGNDPSHCELKPDEPVLLLNNQDSYWWLVKKESDNRIGFAPAECLETYHERLARLNCWKNRELEENSKVLDDEVELSFNNSKSVKNVTFSNEVLSHSEDELDHTDDEQHENDNEFSSNNGSDNFPIIPLTISKRSTLRKFSIDSVHDTETEGESDLESPLIAPNAHFFQSGNNTNNSIGTYSPSTSSEMDSPRAEVAVEEESKVSNLFVKRGNLPYTKGVKDIANSLKLLDDIINDELNTNSKLDAPISFDRKAGEVKQLHPEIKEIFNDSMSKIDSLLQELSDLNAKLENTNTQLGS